MGAGRIGVDVIALHPGLISPGPCPFFFTWTLRNRIRNSAPDTLVPNRRPLTAPRSQLCVGYRACNRDTSTPSPFPPLLPLRGSDWGKVAWASCAECHCDAGEGSAHARISRASGPRRLLRRLCPAHANGERRCARCGDIASYPLTQKSLYKVCAFGELCFDHRNIFGFPNFLACMWGQLAAAITLGKRTVTCVVGWFSRAGAGGNLPSSEHSSGSHLLVRCHVRALEEGAAPSSIRLSPNRVRSVRRLVLLRLDSPVRSRS